MHREGEPELAKDTFPNPLPFEIQILVTNERRISHDGIKLD